MVYINFKRKKSLFDALEDEIYRQMRDISWWELNYKMYFYKRCIFIKDG